MASEMAATQRAGVCGVGGDDVLAWRVDIDGEPSTVAPKVRMIIER
jgi:hypothetical protein